LRLFAGLAGGILTLIAVLTLWFRRQAIPINTVAAAMDRVADLDLARVEVKPSSILEIQNMNRAIIGMVSNLRSFLRYMPQDLVRLLNRSGQEAKLGGEARELTIFFSDIAGFTSLAEAMTPQELIQVLGKYLVAMTEVISQYGGTVDKFLGDGILAFWGAPVDDPEHAEHAALAARACQARLDELSAEGAFGKWELKTRIGIATGTVIVGNFGTPNRMNYTVMGDVANLASRLEGLNKVYATRILISESTATRLQTVRARAVDVVAVKGKEQPVKVYELLPPPSREHNSLLGDISNLSDSALKYYLARDFKKAVTLWTDVLALRPGDGAASTMRKRAEGFLQAPPPPEWKGVFVASEK
jgi:adenylate cyclase